MQGKNKRGKKKKKNKDSETKNSFTVLFHQKNLIKKNKKEGE